MPVACRIAPAAAAVVLLPVAASAQSPAPRVAVELEGGLVWQSLNDAEIPNDGSATRFSIADLIGGGPWPTGRAYLTWNVNDRHGIRALVAPLSVTESGVPDQPLRFAGSTFASGEPVSATYTFNSYRLTYRYRWHAGARSTAWVGFTGKVRDAVIALDQGATSARKDDLGFVPLLHVAGQWAVTPTWRVTLDADALAGGPGRAVDAALKIAYDRGGAWAVNAGYRTVEGGADVEEVYSFAWLHYAVAGVVVRW